MTALTTGARASAVGTAHTRVEGRDKVTGAARYAGEIPFDGLAHGWLVLSTITRGRVLSVDADPVLGMPGVLTVLHHGNAPRVDIDYTGMLGMPPDPTIAVFQHDRVPHAGWPVALVVAETSEQAREAAESLVVRYEEEAHDVTFPGERPDASTGPGPGGPGATEKGDLEAELAASAFVLDAEYSTPEEHHNSMEPHAVTALWDGGRLEVVDSNQGTVWVADELAKLFSLDPASVRVRSEHVGGGFGSKGVRAHQVAAVMAATSLSRPVRVVMTRRQMFSLAGYRSPTTQRVRLGADAEGRLRALEHRCLSRTSTVHEFIESGAGPARVMYDAPAHHTENRVVELDVPSPTFMRAPGEAPGSFALESAIDELAEQCGIDPIELRLRNEPEVGPVSGLPFSTRNLPACFREGARRFGWADRDPRPGVRREGRWLLGTGTAAASFFAGAAPSTAAVTAEADGTFTVRINAADIGTGARTALTLVAADAFEVPTDRVRVRIGDSDFGPAMIAGGSMGTRSWAWAVTAAAGELRERLSLGDGIPPEGITVRSDTTEAVGALAQKERHSFGAQFAEVAVDVATGEVRVRRMLGVFAAGRIVNPLTARGQFTGGMIWGISMALHEEAVRDRNTGALYGADLAGYHVATNADVPLVEADWVDDPDPDDPVGIKGIGEIGIVGAAAAVANAVWHATGVRHRALPIRPDRVLTAGTRA
ncbi:MULTISPECIES: xanthine dehydrogenase family protein molybdopterin-binding subunit [Streptomyces]|uniref:Xanthine dehydrogenase family protein molybdopterin-binding subunit n=1 Tax=Streptomyces silvae TaxID=2803812 RepID=A0ABU8A537_9ACTN|nr:MULTISPECIES: xanthine dehydrogenase family protein molybdopterin-binding subunit [unclassified Streptomyces]WSS70402.1 xanthine dehydrogenase family protein molybdopterin-binding subunit [Streptomyces sp. NBC_01175]MDX3328795.1 xanthine dehydrogenase family protein molybdopterin-binding subunit [Streptomyces sp. ME02-6979-3A]MDX3431852.1 xanthine dehydrogenase family protein molybdopterin-binding subunit [Streptomyces sp. ME01-18a]MDX3682117.1 xanthine dehydrogenase family protein molybdopt